MASLFSQIWLSFWSAEASKAFKFYLKCFKCCISSTELNRTSFTWLGSIEFGDRTQSNSHKKKRTFNRVQLTSIRYDKVIWYHKSWVDNVDWPPLRVSKLTFQVLPILSGKSLSIKPYPAIKISITMWFKVVANMTFTFWKRKCCRSRTMISSTIAVTVSIDAMLPY